jgi:hypothetical protein
MSQAYPNFSCSNFNTNFNPGGCITVISFDERGRGICLKNHDTTGAIIS